MADSAELTHSPVDISFIADRYLRYPGETVKLDAYLKIHQDIDEIAIRISIPQNTALGSDTSPIFESADIESKKVNLSIMEEDGFKFINWAVGAPVPSSSQIKCSVTLKVSHEIDEDTTLTSLAGVGTSINGELFETGEAISISVASHARFLEHLPAIYREDELMNRLLMLFESFWVPIENQVDGLSDYFDPLIAPPGFLPWLASWMDITLNQRWPEESQRKLILNAYKMYRKRGTKQGMVEILEIFTGGQPSINEHLANNFVLGQNSKLGHAIALGKSNLQNTFTVTLRLPPAQGATEEERNAKEELRQRQIRTIIEQEKPAYTGYNIEIDTIHDPALTARGNR